MTSEISPPDKIWIITQEPSETTTDETTTDEKPVGGATRGSGDTGGLLGSTETTEEIVISKKQGELVIVKRQVEVTKLQQEMRGFIQAMRQMLDEAESPNSKMQLDEVELSVEINGEGNIGLMGIGGAKAGGKGGMTFKFKRR
ncbi:MAG: hypothetical protein QNJ36_18500 [Calothrix sp. MO_167.B42]|nr:hypothetical protein [Calothrix sp. MO_167.B42]